MDDASLIAMFFSRNEYAVTELASKYGKYCFCIAMNILGSREDAEEVVNDVYQRTWQSIPPQKPTDLKAYLAKIARNLSYNRIEAANTEKRRTVGTLVYDELDEVLSADAENIVDRLAIEKALNVFLSSLDKNDRILFVKRYFYNEGLDALARIYKTTRGAIKVKLYRLRKQFKRQLEAEGVLVKEKL